MTTTQEPRPSVRSADVIVPFSEVRRADVPTVGGKGASLGEMTAAGLPVPDGFILTIEAYRQFYDANRLGARIAEEAKRVDPDDPAALERVASALRTIVFDAPIPEHLAVAIESAYEALVKQRPTVELPSARRPRPKTPHSTRSPACSRVF
jgi:pyruvate,water dikinase